MSYILRRILVAKRDYEEAVKKWNRNEARRKKDNTIRERSVKEFMVMRDTILFDTVFKETGNETDSPTQTNRNKNFCYDALDYWKATGIIKDYTKKKEGKTVIGISLVF